MKDPNKAIEYWTRFEDEVSMTHQLDHITAELQCCTSGRARCSVGATKERFFFGRAARRKSCVVCVKKLGGMAYACLCG